MTVEQCAECRDFLDRGELEHLVAAEARYNSAPPAPPTAGPRPHSYDDAGAGRVSRTSATRTRATPGQRRVTFDDQRRSDRRHSDDDYYRGKPKKRKKSFLEEFFD